MNGIAQLIKDSVMDNSHVSSIRLQAWCAFVIVYGVFVTTNTTLLINAVVRGTAFTLYGWIEIVSLTGGLFAGKVVQAFSKGDQPKKEGE